MKETKGITLIALIITIIVLLILAGITLTTVTEKNGILVKASSANIENRGASVQEARDLWKTNQNADNYSKTETALTLEELLDDLENQKLIYEKEREIIEETGEITIGTRTIIFGKPPIIELAEVIDKTTDTITIKIKAISKEKLDYSLYVQKEGEGWILGKTLENQKGGEEVFLTAENLLSYTHYDWYVSVSDGEEMAYFRTNEKVRTYCPSGLEICKGPFPAIVSCDTCNR